MKKISVIAATAFFAIALQISCSAASVLFNIPTVLSANEYASQRGRTVEEVMQTVESSAKAQLENGQATAPAETVVPTTPTAPTVTAPAYGPVVSSTPTYLNPSAEGAVSGAEVTIMLVNGIPTIFTK